MTKYWPQTYLAKYLQIFGSLYETKKNDALIIKIGDPMHTQSFVFFGQWSVLANEANQHRWSILRGHARLINLSHVIKGSDPT